ncbi:MAG: SDR family oxidoreductase [Candidatus Aminicenantes bacterium]|nr:SDR family oxidoreductase [Candidatus Aminicenantes bacterium]
MDAYLVTGGAGFIGSHLAEELVKRGGTVRILDNFLTGKKENLSSFQGDIELIRGDIREPEVCRKAVKGVDYVLHQAALPSVPRSINDPALANSINVEGTLNILTASRDEGVQKFVFASSSSVYGDDPALPKSEGNEGSQLSPYAVTKLAGEKYCLVFNHVYGLPTACLRYFNVFGPRQDPHSEYAAVIPNFVTKLGEKKAPVIYGDGEQSRDFTYIADVVEANILAAKSTGPGGVFNIGCGSRTTVNALAGILAKIMNVEIAPVHENERPGDVRHSFADISRAKKELKYLPRVRLEEGLTRTVQWFSRQV